MNELLQKHGTATVFAVPEGLKELMADITREVLRWQPAKTLDFIANSLSALLITREHGVMAVKILEDLCDCRPTVAEHLLQIGMERKIADELAVLIKDEIELDQPAEGKEKVKETEILKKVLHRYPLDEEMSVKVCQVARNAYRDYWYRKNLMKQSLKMEPDEPWEKAAQHTLEIYKTTRPSISELRRATEKIQAAYRGYHVRRSVLKHLMPERKRKHTRKVELPGPPLDIATSREMDLGPVINVRVKKDDVESMFDEEAGNALGLKYDPTKTLTDESGDNKEKTARPYGTRVSVMEMILKKSTFSGTDYAVHSDRSEKVIKKTSPIPEHYMYHHRISFAEAPPEIIKLGDDESFEVPEAPGLSGELEGLPITEPPGPFEIPEELAVAREPATIRPSNRRGLLDYLLEPTTQAWYTVIMSLLEWPQFVCNLLNHKLSKDSNIRILKLSYFGFDNLSIQSARSVDDDDQ